MASTPVLRLLRHAALIALVLIAGLTCRDRDPLAPGLPGHGALDVAPVFQLGAIGAPEIPLARVQARLIRDTRDGAKDTVTTSAAFEGDSAVLRFEVLVVAPSQLFALEVEAVDDAGVAMFRGDDTVRTAPGTSPARGAPMLRYVGPDTALTSLVLTPLDTLLEAGDTLRLAAAGFASDETPVAPVALGWAARNPLVATASSTGLVSALQLEGETWIVARTFTGVADSARIVVRGGVASVAISPDSAAVLAGSSVAMYAETRDAAGTLLSGREVLWKTLDPEIASVSLLAGEEIPPPSDSTLAAVVGTNGLSTVSILGLAPGVARIVAASGSHADTVPIRVESTAGIVVRTEVRPRLDTLESLGDTLQLLAASYDAAGALAAGSYTWAVRDPLVASVTRLGSVVAVADGETWAVVTEAGGTSDSAHVVVRRRVASVAIAPFTARVLLGGTHAFTASPVDGRGHVIASAHPVTWVTESRVYAQMDATGVATGTGIGEETVYASIDGVAGRALLSVVSPVASVRISPESATIDALGAVGPFTAVAYDSAGAVIDAPVLWETSNPAVLAVSQVDGALETFTARANGSATLRAKILGVPAEITVRVQQRVASIDLGSTTIAVAVGGTARLSPRPRDANGHLVPGVPADAYTWSSDPAIAAVMGGLVQGVAPGSTPLTASLDSVVSGATLVDVSDLASAVIFFDRDTVAVGLADSMDVAIHLSRPNTAGAVDLHLSSSDPALAVSPSIVRFDPGTTRAIVRLHGLAAGSATILAADSLTGYGTATVVAAAMPGAALDPLDLGMNATDEIPVRVRLTHPAPAGGMALHVAVEPADVVSVSPVPVVIPAGHLSADIVVRGERAGEATLTPMAAGVRGMPARIAVADAVLAFTTALADSGCHQCETYPTAADATATEPLTDPGQELRTGEALLPSDGSIVLGAGQYLAEGQYESRYLGGLAVVVPRVMHRSLTLAIGTSDPTVVRTDESITIGAGWSSARLGLGGLRVGEVMLFASAPGWTQARQRVVVSTPRLGICCAAERFVGDEDQLSVYVTDSLGQEHPRIASLVTRVTTSDPSVVMVLDTAPVIAPNASSNWSVRIVAKAAGSAWVKVRAGGHIADSIEVRVSGGGFWLRASPTIGEQQRDAYAVSLVLPRAATTDQLFTIASSAPAVLAVPATVTIPAGGAHAYVPIDGIAKGTATVTATSPDQESREVGITVTDGRLLVMAHADTIPLHGTRMVTVYLADETGVVHTARERVVASVRAREEHLLRVEPDSIVIEPGQSSGSGVLRGLSVGSTIVRAQAPSHLDDSTGTLTVIGSAIRVNDGLRRRTIGAGQRRSGSVDYVALPEPRTVDVQVRTSGAMHVQVSATVTIPAGATWAELPVSGLAPGEDVLLIQADGYAPDTLFYSVTEPRLIDASSLPVSVPFGSNGFEVRVRPGDTAGEVHATERELTVRLRSTNPDVLTIDSAWVHIPAGATISSAALAGVVGLGPAAVIFEDSAGVYAPDTSTTIMVTSPPLSFASSLVSVGAGQQTEDYDQYVSLPVPATAQVTILLSSSDPRVASVPQSVVIPAGSTSAPVRVVGGGVTGTVQIHAVADGYHPATSMAEVGQPTFGLSIPTWSYTVDPPQPVSVWAMDQRGTVRTSATDVIVRLESSNPAAALIDSTTVTIRAGTMGSGVIGAGANLVVRGVGTTVIAAVDASGTTAGYRRAESDTVQVRRPEISLSYSEVHLGIGQYVNDDVWLAGKADTARMVSIARTNAGVASAPTSVQVAAGESYAAMRLTAAVTGVDTLVASASGYLPDTTVVRVGPGTIDLLTSAGYAFTALRVGDVVAVRVAVLGPAGAYGGPVAVATDWTAVAGAGIALSADAAGTIPLDRITVPADGTLSGWFYVRGVTAGTVDLTLSQPSYTELRRTIRVDP